MRPLTLLSFLLFFNSLNALVDCTTLNCITPSRECDSCALVALYDDTDGGSWTINTDWKSPTVEFCDWYGVTCSGDRVLTLTLGTNGLNGTIPSEIGSLTKLTLLDFQVNNLSGSMPAEIWNLINLTHLNLSNNALCNPIPSIPSPMTNLTGVYLYNNNFTSIPSTISKLSAAQTLWLFGNDMSGETLPPGIWDIITMVDLNISYCKLMGTIGTNVKDMTNLYKFDAQDNDLTDPIPNDLWSLPQLNYLSLRDNNFSGTLTSAIWGTPSLETLVLSQNGFDQDIPSVTNTNTTLINLILNDCSFDSLPADIDNLTVLQTLNCTGNDMSGKTLPLNLGNMNTLTHIDLAFCKLEGEIPSSMTTFPNLVKLELRDNNLSKPVPDFSNTNSGNVALYIHDNKFNFDGMEENVPLTTFHYSPQQNIPIYKNCCQLYVHAGGTHSKNNYQWYKDNVAISAPEGTMATYIPTEEADYFVQVTNNCATALTLQSDVYTVTCSDNSWIFVTDSGTDNVRKLKTDGSGVTTLTNAQTPRGIQIDYANEDYYYIEGSNGTIRTGSTNTGGSALVIGGLSIPIDIDIDIPNALIYFSDDDKIKTCEMDGSNVQTIYTGDYIQGLALDLIERKIYFIEGNLDEIWVVDMDGSNDSGILTGISTVGIAFDANTQIIYWTDRGTHQIRKYEISTSTITDITSTGQFPSGISLDLMNEKVYWADGGNTDKIRRVNFDGTGKEDVFSGLNSPSGLEIDIQVPCTILPIELVDFHGKREGNKVQLFWETSFERNNDYFFIEHSWDGRNFSKIGKVNGFGTTTHLMSYDFEHENPSFGVNYYRLKQFDFDGTFTYSNVISLDFDKVSKIEIFPNPTTGILDVKAGNKEIFEVKLIDHTGKILNDIQVNNNQLDLSDCPKGLYFLNIYLEGGNMVVEKILKE